MAAILLLCGVGGIFCQDQKREGILTVSFILSSGGAPLDGMLEVFSSDHKKIQEKEVHGEGSLRLPYGQYELRFTQPLMATVARTVTIDKREQFLVMAVPLNNFISDFSEINKTSVQIRIAQSATRCAPRPMWAKLVGVYSTYSEEQKFDDDRRVVFDDLDQGLYIISVVSASGVEATQVAQTTLKMKTIDLELKTCK